MTFEFDANAPFVVVNGAYSTGAGKVVSVLRLLLDTGASSSVVKPTALTALSDLKARTGSFHRVETAGGVVTAVEVRLPALFALGQMHEEFSVSVLNSARKQNSMAFWASAFFAANACASTSGAAKSNCFNALSNARLKAEQRARGVTGLPSLRARLRPSFARRILIPRPKRA